MDTGTLREEFRWKMFKLSVPSPDTFHQSKFRAVPPVLLMVIRCVLALFYISINIVSLKDIKHWYFVFYLTETNYILVGIHLITLWIISFYGWRRSVSYNLVNMMDESGSLGEAGNVPDEYYATASTNQMKSTSKHYLAFLRFAWFLCNVVTSSSSAIVIMFWTIVDVSDEIPSGLNGYLVVEQHGLLLITLYVNFFLGLPPVCILHMVYPMVFGWIYIAIVSILWKTYGFVPYQVLDFNNLDKTLPTCFLATFVGLPVLHLMFFGLNRVIWSYCRSYIHQFGRQSEEEEEDDVRS